MAKCSVGCKMFAFILVGVVTLGYCGVELAFAVKEDSLTLLSDGFHNLSDVVALYIAFWALKASQREISDEMSYGWARTELLGALTNGAFLLALCLFIILEAIPLFISPQKLENASLEFIIIAAAGVGVNTFGTIIFAVSGQSGHGHSHGGGHGHSHGSHSDSHKAKSRSHSKHDKSSKSLFYSGNQSKPINDDESAEIPLLHDPESLINTESDFHAEGHDHDHDHDHHDHDHNHDHDKHGHKHRQHNEKHKQNHNHDSHDHNRKPKKRVWDANVYAVFIHYLGDMLSSVFVLAAGLLLHFFPHESWISYVDPVCSLLIVALILFTTIPLVRSGAKILLQGTPAEIEMTDLRMQITKLPGVLNIHDFHVWQLVDGLIISSIHVACEEGCDFAHLAERVKAIFHQNGIHSTCIQPEFVPKTHENTQKNKVVCQQNCVTDCDENWCCKKTADKFPKFSEEGL